MAPLKLADARGKSSNFLIRLREAETNELVEDIFVRAGDVIEVNVPLGRYRLRIAAGQTWRGDSVLFGDAGAYAQANESLSFTVEGQQVVGNRIVLQESVGGNLRKTAMKRTQF